MSNKSLDDILLSLNPKRQLQIQHKAGELIGEENFRRKVREWAEGKMPRTQTDCPSYSYFQGREDAFNELLKFLEEE